MKYFGTDGIRGIANDILSPEIAFKIGRYLGNSNNGKSVVYIGNDSRISANMLEASLISGITSAGGDVYTLGVVPTPTVTFLTKTYSANFGVIISASHNPASDNGIKIVDSSGNKISDEIQLEIEKFIDGEDTAKYPKGPLIGRVFNKECLVEDYINYLCNSVNSKFKKFKIVFDCANGASSLIAKKVFEKFNFDITFINDEPNGVNINDGCGSTHMEGLVSEVVKSKADIGIAMDGDADRVLVVDADGSVCDGDIIVYLLANLLKYKGYNIDKVALTSMTNLGAIKALNEDMDIEVVVTDVGDKNVAIAIDEHNLLLGGESCGHIIYKNYANSGDGLLISLLILEYLSVTDYKLNHYTKTIQKFPSKLTNIKVIDKEYVLNNRLVVDEVKRVSNIVGKNGRAFIRASGTEQLIRVLVECESAHDVEKYSNSIVSCIKSINNEV